MKERFRKNGVKYLDPSGQQGVFDENAFRFILRRERDRSDRTGHPFSLVVLRLPSPRRKGSDRWLLNALAKRIRITDTIGRLNSSSLGILLPDTPPEGAAAFLEKTVPTLSDAGSVPEIEIHIYPQNPATGDSGGRTADSAPDSSPDPSRFFSDLFAVSPVWMLLLLERFAAGLALLILSPVFVVIALVIKASSSGPVFFRQERIGQRGEPFYCYKFRTMRSHSETQTHEDYFSYLMERPVPMEKLDKNGDERIFAAGHLLRSSSLDELPQLINVFKGEMRLIGPRPCTPHEFEHYLPWHRHRTDALPGLTGLWQVSGKNRTTFTEMMRLDLRYIRTRSVLMDLRIILKTIPVTVGLFFEERFGRGGPAPDGSLCDAPFLNAAQPARKTRRSFSVGVRRTMQVAAFLFFSSAPAARVLFFQADPGNPDVENRLRLACRFYGADLQNGFEAEAADTPTVIVIEAGAPGNLSLSDLPADHRGLLIAGIHDRTAAEDLRRLTGESLPPIRDPLLNKPGSFVTVAAERSGFTAELAGENLPVDIAKGYALPDAGGTPILSYPDGRALFSVFGKVFLLADLSVSYPPDASIWFYDRGFFAEIAPYMMFLRNAFGEYGWHTDGDFANLTVDDPWLRERYGNLRFDELLEEMNRADFHTTIAFIPWNYDRPSEPGVAALFHGNPNRLSICIHGNNHDHREFYSYEPKPGAQWPPRPLAEQEADIRQALARIEALEQRDRVPVDRIMVFPHDISPDRTLELLKKYNFKATANIGKVPLDTPQPDDPLVWLRRVTDLYGGGLATLDRTEAAQRTTADIAIDLFLDNPVLFVEHARYFSDSRAAFNPVAAQVNRLQPDVQWVGLGTLADSLYLMRKEDDGTWTVRSFSPDIVLRNPGSEPRRYRVLKNDDGRIPIRQILADDLSVDLLRRSDREIQIDITVPPQEQRRIRIVFENDFVAANEELGKPDRKVNTLRYLSDFRDQHLMTGPFGAVFHRFYYGTSLYRFGIKAVLMIAVVLLLIPAILFSLIRKRMKRKR